MHLDAFNELSAAEAEALLRPCVDADRWIHELISARPFATRDELTSYAMNGIAPFDPQELDAALAQHPRIGERAEGQSKEADLSRGEQASLNLDDDAAARLKVANRNYEQRFDRVFLIRAAGRSTEEILAECERRLDNDEATELAEAATQLREIAVLRLNDLLTK
ncbi:MULTISPECIES: 2-oxo-4-hydroxy-4-carboxy-5-ureidoimidazoline decarboxylase [Glutamicibacter]|uniref:2-oxo-4-hydroxy-4-carboxy-5-ureidoimidazoline decarboxylase n=1 Tax=Glutamicibacter halophytocola TaxID=1933880 RepID=A0AA94XUD7_9MICC|nr:MULTISPECIES: 2-oxo-4-hydroxy-4-carboxy-5-ureidoimidazoline decarboxylase [Glutamicibacter]MBF6673143.1 2-oxo-4-hydroxy-4-carboxy-5-ureidoimidazoline decarboxylase [Glutamicibacter sp. FBE19]UUX59019.1 2-oxo-4-hydroxy-4-carboxy-5-ureidoimidazoline decarboxylase [Glutamicibacter halophytocola]